MLPQRYTALYCNANNITKNLLFRICLNKHKPMLQFGFIYICAYICTMILFIKILILASVVDAIHKTLNNEDK